LEVTQVREAGIDWVVLGREEGGGGAYMGCVIHGSVCSADVPKANRCTRTTATAAAAAAHL
jgi:hypothetical protein